MNREGWSKTKVKYLADYINGYAFAPEDWGDEGRLIVRIQNLTDPQAPANRTTLSVPAKYRVEMGDILISWSASLGVHVWEREPGCLNQHIFKAIPRDGVHRRFFIWAARWFIGELAESAHGSTMQHLTKDAFGGFNVPMPPQGEQERIANFLDEHTARIDSLIAEKERLVSLLDEYFDSRLGQVFRTGLRGSRRLMRTGLDWLPTVPAHWSLPKFMSLASVVRGASPRPAGDPRYFSGEFIPWVTVAELTKDEAVTLTSTETRLTAQGAQLSRRLSAGTLLLTNSGATLGVPKILGIDACANDGVVGFERLSPRLDIHFAYYYLRSLTDNLRDRIRQGAGQPNLNTAIIKNLPVPLPPPDEQAEIVAAVRTLDERRVELKGHVTLHLARLREYRSSLISAAVTGQMDIDAFQSRLPKAA